MRRTLTCVALAAALLGGCKSEQATPGAVKLVVEFQGFRPECVRVTAWDADAPDKRNTQPVKPASLVGPLQSQDKRGTLTVAVFRGADWGRNLRMSAEGFEKGACNEGSPLAGREPVAVVESGTVVTRDGKVVDAVTLSLSALDADGDGYVTASGAKPGKDCNDGNNEAYPGAAEDCNGLDDDCDAEPDDGLATTPWYLDEDGDTYGLTASLVNACERPTPKHVARGGDCRDTGPAAAISFPGASEVCDGLDNNCDTTGTADEGFDVNASCSGGNICQGKKVCAPSGTATVCQGEVFQETWYPDGDGDTKHGGTGVAACAAPAGHSKTNADCNDGDPFTYSGATEICDGRDNDCNPATSDADMAVCPAGGGSYASILQGAAGSFNWRSVVPWGNGGVWIVGEAGNWARRPAGESNFTTGACGGSTIWYSLWVDPRQGGLAYYAGTNERLAVVAQDSTSCTENPPKVGLANFTTRGLMGFTQNAGAVTLHGGGNTSGTGSVGKTFVWNGSASATVPVSTADTVPLKDLHGVGLDTLFAVGDAQPGKSPILKFNPGTSLWEAQTVPAGTKNLLGVYVVSPKLAYAVGETGTVLKWNGTTSWDVVAPDSNGPGTGTLRSVLAFGEGSVYVASQSGFVFRYNGTGWEKLATMTDANMAAVALYDIAGTRPDDIWVVGEDGRAYHWPR